MSMGWRLLRQERLLTSCWRKEASVSCLVAQQDPKRRGGRACQRRAQGLRWLTTVAHVAVAAA